MWIKGKLYMLHCFIITVTTSSPVFVIMFVAMFVGYQKYVKQSYNPIIELSEDIIPQLCQVPAPRNRVWVKYGIMSHSVHYRSFWGRLYGLDNLTNTVTALNAVGAGGRVSDS